MDAAPWRKLSWPLARRAYSNQRKQGLKVCIGKTKYNHVICGYNVEDFISLS